MLIGKLKSDRLLPHEQDLNDALTRFELGRRQWGCVLTRLLNEAFSRRGMHNRRVELTLGGLVEDYIAHLDHHLDFVYRKRLRCKTP